jgi:hypothetical protein
MKHMNQISPVEVSTLSFDIIESINKLLLKHDSFLTMDDDKEIYVFLVKILEKYQTSQEDE